MQTKSLILLALFIISAIFYYQITDVTTSLETFQAKRIIDGDTLEIETGNLLRLKGINTPEKKMPLFNEATNLLKSLVQNKSIQIETHGTDKYGRTLSHIFLEDKYINKEIIQQGLATLYYYDHDAHYEELKQAEEFARLNQKGLWEKSPNANCIQLIEFKTDEPEKLTLKNNCNKILNITYKDDATHIYKATIQPNSQYTETFSHIWNTDGDSIHISDEQGLILFQRY